MTPEQQRIAIAEACGWSFEKKPRENMLSQTPAWHITRPDGIVFNHEEIWYNTRYGRESKYNAFQGELEQYLEKAGVPDYLNDLNAMHEAEKTLGDFQNWLEYDSTLARVPDHVGWKWHVTATQRAEAFLRTLNLWIQ